MRPKARPAKLTPPPPAPQPREWPRADPDELAKFDPATKTCNMNCGPASGDPRSRAERLFLCSDC